MNKIQALLDVSDYDETWEYFNFHIDDYWLDEKLGKLYPDRDYKGLIPTLVEWIEREEEKQVVWKRILPAENQTSICPILMCPDDNDFSCTLIVAEIVSEGNEVRWNKLGLDKTNEWEAEKVGTVVEWLEDFPKLTFSKSDYLTMLGDFMERMEVDRQRSQEILTSRNTQFRNNIPNNNRSSMREFYPERKGVLARLFRFFDW